MNRPATKRVTLDERAIQAHAVGSALVLDARKIGKSVTILAAAPPETERHLWAFDAALRGLARRAGPDDEELEEPSEDAAATPTRRSSLSVVRVIGPLAQRRIDDLCGYVDGYDAVAARVVAALSDPESEAVVIEIDSPGGDVAGCEESIEIMRQAKAATDKPVVVYVGALAASAGCWLATQLADHIVVHQSAEIGSIGCVCLHCDMTEGEEAKGRRWTVVREPEGKAEGSFVQPVMDLAVERMRAGVQSVAARFYAAVSGARGIAVDTIAAMNGACFEGAVAVEMGLADSVGGFAEALERAASLAQEKHDMKIMEAVAASLGLAKDASEETILAAAKDAGTISAHLASVTGEKTPAGQRATVAAWKESHEWAIKERAALEEQTKKAEKAERITLLGSLIVAGWETPATAFENPTEPDAAKREPKGSYATQPIEELRARASTLCAAPRGASGAVKPELGAGVVTGPKAAAPTGPTPIAGAAADGFSARERKQLAETKVDPEEYAAKKAAMKAARSGAARKDTNAHG